MPNGSPRLCSSNARPPRPHLPQGPDWEYELKLDGYRLQAVKVGEKVRLFSRRGTDFTRKFPKIATTVSKIKASSVILDGEAVVVDNQARPTAPP